MARARQKRTGGRSWPRRTWDWLWRSVAIFVVGSALWVLIYRFVPPPVTFTMLANAADGRGITKNWLSLSAMDPDMARAAIAGEDSRFCEHDGFDIRAIEAAAKRNANGKKLRGGSTISQQTAKNAFLWQGRSWLRKGLEAWFTVLIEALWGKRRIMEVYLNVAETGIGTYGANAAALRYFHHDATHLTPDEAARIAAILPLPKQRAAIDPSGFTRRYGNSITRRIAIVRRGGLDACLFAGGARPIDRDAAPPTKRASARKKMPPPPAITPDNAMLELDEDALAVPDGDSAPANDSAP